jgi:phosphatidylethanolamine-binding protein (PEBP) family uncharacterized protein
MVCEKLMNRFLLFCTVLILSVSILSGCTQATDHPLLSTSESPIITQTPTASIEPSSTPSPALNSEFVLRSPEVAEGGMLPKDYTCDGSSATLPLEWSGEPANTQSFALVMYTIPNPGESHWYWVLYNIPPNTHNLVKNVSGVGTLGNNSVNGKTEYAPPCSKGPGPKLYTYTIYALLASPLFTIPPAEVSRDVLLSTIKDRTLGSAELNVYYSRQNGGQ